MALQIWLPLNGDGHNQGLLNLTPTTLGTVSWVNDGKIGKALSAGTSTQTPNGISYGSNLIDELGTQFSCSIWVRPLGDHVHYNGAFISSGNWNGKAWTFGVSQNNSQVDVFSTGYNKWVTCDVPVNTWTHLVCTNDNGLVKLYKNGQYVGERTVTAGLDSDYENFTVGRETYASGYFSFNGNINDVRIYDHCLSPREVKEISKGLVLHYPLGDSYTEGTTNLITSLRVGGRTVLVDDNKAVKSTGDNADTYFYMKTTALTSGATYTLSCNVDGFLEGKSWGFGIGAQSGANKCGSFVLHNGYNTFTFTLPSGLANATELIWDDDNVTNVDRTTNIIHITNIQLEQKDHATGFTPFGTTRAGGEVYDTSGFGNNGTAVGVTCSNDSARYSVCNFFADYTKTIRAPIVLTTPTAITMAVWIKSSTKSGKGGYQMPFNLNGSAYEFSIDSSGKFRQGFHVAGSRKVVTTSSKNVLDGQWHHLAATFDGTTIKRYVDGELIHSESASGTLNNTSQLFISTFDTGTTYGNVNMYESDLRLYTTALSADDILELYHTPISLSNNGALLTQGEFVES